MTDMRRVTVPIPTDLDKQILTMKKQDEYIRCSYAEIVRILLQRGLEKESAPPA